MELLLRLFLLNLLPIATGVFVSRKGKPYNVVLTAIHKIVSVAVIVATVIMFIGYVGQSETGELSIVFAACTAVCCLTVVGTGGFITYKEEGNEKLVLLHKGISILLMVFLFLTLYIPVS